jgi:hypothetical protein
MLDLSRIEGNKHTTGEDILFLGSQVTHVEYISIIGPPMSKTVP